MDALIGLGWPLSFGSSSLVFARFGVCPFLGVENLVLSLQDSRGVADALGAPLTYRLQGQNPLDVERVQLVGMRQGLEQLVQAPRQPPGIAHASMSSMRSNFSSWLNISSPPSLNGRVAQHRSRSMRRTISPPAVPCAYRPQAARESRPSRLMPRRRDSGTRLRPRHDVVVNPRGSPATADGPHPMPGGSRRPRRIPCRTPAPL